MGVRQGLVAAVAQLTQAEACALRGCAPCRRDASDLKASLIGRRVRWACASDGGTVLQIVDVRDGMVEVSSYSGLFGPHLFKEVRMEQV